MFKAPAPALRRSFSLYARAARSAARHGHSTFHVQPVRILARRRRLAGALAFSTATFAATFAVGQLFGISVEITDAHDHPPRDRQWTKADPQHANGHADDQAPARILLFLPTGFPTPQERVLYTNSDPERQEARALAEDRERLTSIHDELVQTLRRWLMTQPIYVQYFGQIDPSRGRTFLHITVPSGPPLEYDQPGIALTDDLEICIGTRSLDHTQYCRWSALYYPKAVITATWREFKRTTVRTFKQVTSYVAGNTEAKPEPIQEMLKPLSAKPLLPTATTDSPHPPANPPSADSSQPPSPSSSNLADAIGTVHPKTEHLLNKQLLPEFREFLHDSRAVSQSLDFNNPIEAPRGTIILEGQVQIVGSRRRAFVDVVFCYHLKEKRIAVFKINPTVKNGRR